MAQATCDFCHLPVRAAREPGDNEPLYCCYGCLLAARITRARGEAGQINWLLTRLGVSVFLSMTVMMFSMYLYRQHYVGAAEATEVSLRLGGVMRYLSLLFAAPVFVMLAPPIFENAVRGLRRGLMGTDALVILGVAAAFVYSYVSTVGEGGATYYETGCVVLVFMTLGRWLEAQGKWRASEAILSLQSLFPDLVRVRRGAREQDARPSEIVAGDVMLIPAGQRIAADGVIESGRAMIDEQLLTGESLPVSREPGDRLCAGTLNVDGQLAVRATVVGTDSTLGRLIRLLEDARLRRSRVEQLADRVAGAFVPITIGLAVVAGYWGYLRGGWAEAILSPLAVLLIACPCALGIATPTAVWMALGAAARRSILFRGGDELESLARVRAVAFDKTGTLTTGRAAVQAMECAPGVAVEEALSVAAGLATGSMHPLSAGVRAYASARNVPAAAVLNVRTQPGRGLTGDYAGAAAVLGNEAMMNEHHMQWPDEWTTELSRARGAARPYACVGWGGGVRGVISFSEALRPEAGAAVAELRNDGISAVVLTGDHASRGAEIGRTLGVEVRAELDPAGKIEAMRRLRRDLGAVAMVGDGLNDAPALAAADVGIALGCGADLTRESAGVCLLGNRLDDVPWAIRLARRTRRTIRVNLFWAFAYNVVGIGLAMTGRLSPVFAAAAMVVSSVLVVSNSLRLDRQRKVDGTAERAEPSRQSMRTEAA